MMPPALLDPQNALLLVIDVQAKLKAHLVQGDALIHRIQQMMFACQALDIPIWLTEQYPEGLGATIPELAHFLPEMTLPTFSKRTFGCLGSSAFAEALSQTGRKQILISGIEAHVCVHQTVMQLLGAGYTVYLLEDAIGGRHPHHIDLALRKMTQAGAWPSLVEMAIFELVQDAQHPAFKALQKIIVKDNQTGSMAGTTP